MGINWGVAITLMASIPVLLAAIVASVKHHRSAGYLWATMYVLWFPVHLWFWQFALSDPRPVGTGYILEAIFQIAPPVIWLVWSCFHRFRPVITALVLIYLFSLVLQLFSYIYWSYGSTKNFSIGLSHLDSFYFALGTLTTAGTGSISAISETARRLQTLQMGLDLASFGFALALVVARYSNLFPHAQPQAHQDAVTGAELARIADEPRVRRGSSAPRVRIPPPGMRPSRTLRRRQPPRRIPRSPEPPNPGRAIGPSPNGADRHR